MKADSCGTITEQDRHRQGWYPANLRPRCDKCTHSGSKITGAGSEAWYCQLGKFSTAPSACCPQFQKI